MKKFKMVAMKESTPKPNQFGARSRGISMCDLEVKSLIILEILHTQD